MTRIIIFLFLFPASSTLMGQASATKSTEPLTLRERYSEMKKNTETFNEYKVIKEYQLDREWKVMMDSIQAVHEQHRSARQDAARLEDELKRTQELLRQKEESVAPLELAGTHIRFAGIDFNKGAFITLVLIVTAALLCVAGVLAWRMKGLQESLGDRMGVINDLNHEFEDYRRKALEKQTKLSRELQNERNKVTEARRPEGSGTARHP